MLPALLKNTFHVSRPDNRFDEENKKDFGDSEIYSVFSENAGVDNGRKARLTAFLSMAVHRRNLVKRFAYVLCVVALISIWIGVMVAFANQEDIYAQKIKSEDISRSNNGLGNLSGDAIFQGTLRQFDVDRRVLTIQWSGATLDPSLNIVPMASVKNNDSDSFIQQEISVYRDITTVRDHELEGLINSQTLILSDGFVPPFYAISNRSAIPVGTLGVNEWDSFDTDIDLAQEDSDLFTVWRQPLFGYPFDLWSGSIVLSANLPKSAEEANSLLTNGIASGQIPSNTPMLPNNGTGAFVLSFSRVSLKDSIQNWKIEATTVNSCQGRKLIQPVNCELHVTITARRPGIVVFCVIVVVIINWLSTIAIFLLTCESVFLRRLHILSEIDILGVCFSALFALPSVRSLLPAAPEFGALIDLVGILPNVIIISICTTIVAFDRIVNDRLRKEVLASHTLPLAIQSGPIYR